MQECCSRLWNEIVEHASPVLCSCLGKIGQAGDRGWRRPGVTGGARGRGARGADFARGRGARGAGQRPPAPLPTLSNTCSSISRRSGKVSTAVDIRVAATCPCLRCSLQPCLLGRGCVGKVCYGAQGCHKTMGFNSFVWGWGSSKPEQPCLCYQYQKMI